MSFRSKTKETYQIFFTKHLVHTGYSSGVFLTVPLWPRLPFDAINEIRLHMFTCGLSFYSYPFIFFFFSKRWLIFNNGITIGTQKAVKRSRTQTNVTIKFTKISGGYPAEDRLKLWVPRTVILSCYSLMFGFDQINVV